MTKDKPVDVSKARTMIVSIVISKLVVDSKSAKDTVDFRVEKNRYPSATGIRTKSFFSPSEIGVCCCCVFVAWFDPSFENLISIERTELLVRNIR